MGGEMKLTKTEQFLLEWLGEEDSSALGECRGRDLQTLLESGLAELGPYPFEAAHEDYRRVYVTGAGRALLSRIREGGEG